MNFLLLAKAVITDGQITSIVQPIIDVLNATVPALLLLVGAVGAIWCIVLGVKYAKAEDPQEHDKAKKALINAIVGFVLVFVLLVMLKLGTDIFTNYFKTAYGYTA